MGTDKITEIQNKSLLVKVMDGPGWYQIIYNGYYEYTKVNIEIGEDCTEEFIKKFPQSDGHEYNLYVSGCTLELSGVSYVYFIKAVSIYDDRDIYYSAVDSECNYYTEISLVQAQEGNELYSGTYVLENGKTVDIVDADWMGYLLDENEEIYLFTRIPDVNQYIIPACEKTYYSRLPGGYYFTPDGNGGFKQIDTGNGINSVGTWQRKGKYLVLSDKYYSILSNFYKQYDVPEIDGVTLYSETRDECFIVRNEDDTELCCYCVYGRENRKTYYYTFTGTTFDSLLYAQRNNYGLFARDYEITEIPALEERKIYEEITPGVMYNNTGNDVYYNRNCIPVYDNLSKSFIYAFNKTQVFDLTLERRFNLFTPSGYGRYIDISPDDVEKLILNDYEYTWDATEEFKSGELELDFINITNNHYEWAEVTFTDEAFKTKILITR